MTNKHGLAQLDAALENFCVWFSVVSFCVIWWIG